MTSALQTAYAAMAGGPTANWPLDDASGSTIHALVGANGTYTSLAAYAQAPILAGCSDSAQFAFGASGDVSQDLTGGPFSIAWAGQMATGGGSGKYWFSAVLSSSQVRAIACQGGGFMGTNGKWATGQYNGGWVIDVSSSIGIDSSPHFWTLVRDTAGGKLILYMDGGAIATYTGTVAALTGGADGIVLGQQWDKGSTSLVGYLSDFAIWKGTALTAGNVADLYLAAIDSTGGGGTDDDPLEGEFSSVSWG